MVITPVQGSGITFVIRSKEGTQTHPKKFVSTRQQSEKAFRT